MAKEPPALAQGFVVAGESRCTSGLMAMNQKIKAKDLPQGAQRTQREDKRKAKDGTTERHGKKIKAKEKR